MTGRVTVQQQQQYLFVRMAGNQKGQVPISKHKVVKMVQQRCLV